MTQEEKQLLLIDLCARLPYNTIVRINNGKYFEDVELKPYIVNGIGMFKPMPYLRPLSSMTEKEEEEYGKLTQALIKEDDKVEYLIRLPNYNTLDWLNEHFYDYRGLIKKRLALKAPEGMYNK